MATVREVKQKKSTNIVTQYYLFLYNALSAVLWFSILIMTIMHLAGYLPTTAHLAPISSRITSATVPGQQRKTLLASLKDAIPLSSVYRKFTSSTSTSSSSKKLHNINININRLQLPEFLVPAWRRTATTYDAVGPFTSFVQSLAILDIAHVLLNLVRSPLPTTAAQVASRLFMIWGVVELSDVARTTPLYTSMVISWSIAETLKYTYHATSIFLSLYSSQQSPQSQQQNGNANEKQGIEIPYILKYLRYTAFYLLYPTGASSEAFVNYSTLPRGLPWPFAKRNWWSSVDALVNSSNKWMFWDYIKGTLFIIWWPALYIMMSHMIKQRRKVIGVGKKQRLGSKPKTL